MKYHERGGPWLHRGLWHEASGTTDGEFVWIDKWFPPRSHRPQIQPMHKLIRIVVPPHEAWDDELPIDLDAQSPTDLEIAADEAFAIAKGYLDEAISIHGRGQGGFADWHSDGAGRWSDSLRKEYEDIHRHGRDSEIVLAGDDATDQLDKAYSETKADLNGVQEKLQKELAEHDLDATALLDMDPMSLRQEGLSMARHYMGQLSSYGPQPEIHGYIASPASAIIDTSETYEQALEDISNGGFVVPIDVHC